VTLKADPKAACDPEKCSESRTINVHWRKSTQRKAGIEIDAAFGTIL
jgi:hypothetical protein